VRTVLIAATLLLGGSHLGGTWQLLLVAAAVSIDLIGPFLGGGRGWRLALGHFAERHGLIVIIALGESIVAIGIGAAGLPVSAPLLTVAMLGVGLACALWVAYFDGSSDALESAVDARSGLAQVTTARDVYSYLHFLLVSGLILLALSMESALKHVEAGWAEPLEQSGWPSSCSGCGS
jgi:low temperature requirement protein LtrA